MENNCLLNLLQVVVLVIDICMRYQGQLQISTVVGTQLRL